jgi:hypothetical protein
MAILDPKKDLRELHPATADINITNLVGVFFPLEGDDP